MKIDIEGAEAQALVGMRRILRESRPVVLVEFHNETGWAGREHLLTAGYSLRDAKNTRWLDPAAANVHRVYHCLAVPEECLGALCHEISYP